WINTDAEGTEGDGKVFFSNGTAWVQQNPREFQVSIDLTVPWVRAIILEDLKQRAEKHFGNNPDDVLVFGVDPEDGGGYARFAELRKHPDWYPEYLKEKGVPFGEPYRLNGHGIDQPKELWDAQSPTDTVFGLANWLGR